MNSLQNAVAATEQATSSLLAKRQALSEALSKAKAEEDLLTRSDVVLRALLKQKTDEAFREVEQLLLKGLQTVFGPEWSDVKIEVESVRGRLSAALMFKYMDFEPAPPLEAFGGGPASVASFILRMLVVRRMGLAPLLLLDESFSQVSASAVPELAKFLRLVADKLGMTIVWVTHQTKAVEFATMAYSAELVKGQTKFERVS